MHILIFAYCTPHSQNRPSDTQIHAVMKTPEQFNMFAFAIATSESDQFIEGFFSCKCMKRRQRDNYVLCANLLSPLLCAKATMCYPILKTTSTCGPDSGVFYLKFMRSLSFCLRLIILADSLDKIWPDKMLNVVVAFFHNKGADKTVLSACWSATLLVKCSKVRHIHLQTWDSESIYSEMSRSSQIFTVFKYKAT